MISYDEITEKSDWFTRNQLSSDDALLIQCAHLDLSQKEYQIIRRILIDGKPDWDSILEKAKLQRLGPLVAHHLMTSQIKTLVPAHIQKRLRQLYYSNLARNMFLQTEVSCLMTVFHDEEIPVIILKGAALLGNVYKNIGLRPMSDLDILVQPYHLDKAEAIALSQGYVHVTSRETQNEARRNWHQLPYMIHQEKKITLEIHQHFVDSDEPYRFDLSDFWARAQSHRDYNNTALVLAPEDMLIHLSIKFLLDRRYQSNSALGQLCDISEVILYYNDSLDWNLLEKVAEENGITTGLHCVLYACCQLLQTPVPESIMRKFQPLDFRPEMAELFIQRRVLDPRLWLAHGLSDSKVPNSRLGLLKAIWSRFLNLVKNVLKKNHSSVNTRAFYLKRSIDIIVRFGKSVFRPTDVKNDLKLDRWLSELYYKK